MSNQAQIILTATNLEGDDISFNFKVEFTKPIKSTGEEMTNADIVIAGIGQVIAEAIKENYGVSILPGGE